MSQISREVISLNALAQVFEVVNPLRDTLEELSWELHQIVVMGNENSGKSTLLERITMMPLFPVDKRICTRMVIKICLSSGESRPTVLALGGMVTDAGGYRKQVKQS